MFLVALLLAASAAATYTVNIVRAPDVIIYGGEENSASSAAISCGDAGPYSDSKCSAQFNYGTRIAIFARTKEGAMIGFSAWSGPCDPSRSQASDLGQAACFFTLTSDAMLGVATIAPWRVGVSTPAGSVSVSIFDGRPSLPPATCKSTCTVPMFSTKAARIDALPPAGYSFSSWTGACAGQMNPCKLNPGGGQATAAVFKTP